MKHIALTLATLAAFMTGSLRAQTESFDIVIYGGTASGVAAAIQGARMGKKVALVVNGKHIGGMTTGGLGLTDTGKHDTIGGISDEFYHRIYLYYKNPSAWRQDKREEFVAWMPEHWGVDGKKTEETQRMWLFEPHAAEQVLDEMLKESGAQLFLNERLDLKNGVKKDGTNIVSIAMESGRVFAGKEFIDATYEGDLMAKAGVKYLTGRESNAQYGETFNGKYPKPPQRIPIDPYRIAGDPKSGVLPPIEPAMPGEKGDAVDHVQAYNFRLCLTDDPENRVPFAKPANYNPDNYELLARWLDYRRDKIKPGISRIGKVALGGDNSNIGINFDAMPNRKTDSNDGSVFGSDWAGGSKNWPDGDYATREKLWQAHKDYQQGLLWFLANDPRVPQSVRDEMNKWGLAKDEFVDNDNWPYQLYVREARRMISDYVMTEHDATGAKSAEDPIAIASYPLDSHSGSYFIDDKGVLWREPGFYIAKNQLLGISYRSIVPKASECTNLFVTCCLASSHAAYGSIRMEPVLMMLGQAAATAAAIAIDEGTTAQNVPYQKLRKHLLADKMIVDKSRFEPKKP